MMSEDIKPPVDPRDQEDPFLIPPGQPGSLVDALAVAQGWLPGLGTQDVEIQLELFALIRVKGGAS